MVSSSVSATCCTVSLCSIFQLFAGAVDVTFDLVGCLTCVSIFFFLQSEDGIRVLVRSHGLGDVYKRQVLGDIRRHEKTIAVAMAVLVSGAILWRTHGRELLDAWSLRRSRLSRR